MNPLSFIGSVFNLLFFAPVINLLVVILNVFTSLHIPGAMGLSIVVLSVLIRLFVWPFMSVQLRSSKKMLEIKPHIDRLKQKHGKDQQAFAKAQMDLYKEHGVNPAAGCVPSLIQLPIVIALYQTVLALFNQEQGIKHINSFLYPFVPHLQKIPDAHFLGINLANKPSEFIHAGWVLLLVPVITALLQFIQSRMISPKPVKEYPSDSSKEKKEKVEADTMTTMQNQMMYMMPLMIGFFSWQFPVGLAIYWNTFTIFGILQQYKILGLGGLEDWVKKSKSLQTK